jgi:uncharacterized membrane protein YgcG
MPRRDKGGASGKGGATTTATPDTAGYPAGYARVADGASYDMIDVPQMSATERQAECIEFALHEERAKLTAASGGGGGGRGLLGRLRAAPAGLLASSPYTTIDMKVPLASGAGGVPDAATMAAWLRAQYEGHADALDSLIKEIVVDTQPAVASEDARDASQQSSKRNELAQKYGTLYRFDEQMSEWVFFHTKDYTIMGGLRGPGWCWKYRSLLCYRFMCCHLSQLGLSATMGYLAIVALTTVSLGWVVAFFYSTLEKLGPLGSAVKAVADPFFGRRCVMITLGTDNWCFVPVYGTIVTAVLTLWLLLAGTPWVKWTARRLVFSSTPRNPTICGKWKLPAWLTRAVPCPMFARWNCCCLPFHSLVQVKHRQVRSARVRQSFVQSCFGLGNIELTYMGSGTLDGVSTVRDRAGRSRVLDADARQAQKGEHSITVHDIPQVHSIFDTISYQLSLVAQKKVNDGEFSGDDDGGGGGGAEGGRGADTSWASNLMSKGNTGAVAAGAAPRARVAV